MTTMDWPEVVHRIGAGEDEHTEFKRDVDLWSLGPALAAFANSRGGLVVVGVNDNQTIVGVKDRSETVSERLTDFLQSGLSAPLNAQLGRHEDANGWVHWIEVPAQRGYEPIRHHGRVYVRRGRASVEPSPSELQELYNRFGYVLTEEQTVMGTSSDAIDRASFERYMNRVGIDLTDEPRIDLEDDLRTRGVLARKNGALLATLYGLLAFGKDPQGHPQTGNFWIKCAAYAGADRADEVVLVGEARGRLDEQVDRALGWLKSLGRQERYMAVRREDRSLVPDVALREALVNAVCHRDYAIIGSPVLLEVFDDRAVVTSPGALPNHMTPQTAMAGGHPRSRNELLATFMQT
ncbi:MAG: putative DNA binding domain-containing protein, partial [Polyangiaceae bacterium]|nr:putative DNA binding domain-containing protein [Polyangiaceae bacterium]